MLGTISLGDPDVETPEVALAKLAAMVRGAELVRREILG
jgi:hypothetical protein